MAAWAGAADSAMPAEAAATATVVRAFFGEAMRRMKETDTENLLRRGRGIARKPEPPSRGGRVRRRPGPFGRWRLATSTREAAPKGVRNDPFY
ncbi:hypothetical protein TNCT1_29160 [Streptomyces sp. 1-11]|nr:hypothetical protein TNCT1_29160 [Streptomyces sp. 1-11]